MYACNFIFIDGFIESQIDYLKCIQAKLTLFSIQSDKYMSKNDLLIDECVQVLSILNSLSFDCHSAKRCHNILTLGIVDIPVTISIQVDI
ncbi:unnamed protein product [Rotaria socialis]